MKYLVQRPHPGELLSSVWLRSRRRAGVGIGLVTQCLTNRKFAPGFLSVSHVGDLAHALGMAPLDLLWRHSIFPYATAFMEPGVFESSLAVALSTGHNALGTSATIQSVSDHIHFRRYCHTCARQDEMTFGESYWHREHQLPGVLQCAQHAEALRETDIPVNQFRPWPDVLPRELKAHQVIGAKSAPFDIDLARRSLALLHRGEVASAPRNSAWYRAQLTERGLLSEQHQVNSEQLVQWASEQLKSHVKHLGLAERDQTLGWLSLMVRPHIGIPFVPLKHVIFQTLLAASGHVNTPVVDYKSRGMSARSSKVLDQEYAIAVKAVVKKHRVQGHRIRVCDALMEAGCWSTYRHARSSYPRLKSLVDELRRSETSVRPIKTSSAK